MPVPNIFTKGDPVEATKVNDDFAYVLTSIQEAVEGASGELEADITNLNNQYQQTKNKVNALDVNVCKLTGSQTLTGQKTFNGNTIFNANSIHNAITIVKNDTTIGSAIALAGLALRDDVTTNISYIMLGCNVLIQWGAFSVSSSASDRGVKTISLPKAYKEDNSFITIVTPNTYGSNDATVDWNEVGLTEQSKSSIKIRYAANSYNKRIMWCTVGKCEVPANE